MNINKILTSVITSNRFLNFRFNNNYCHVSFLQHSNNINQIGKKVQIADFD